VQATLNGFGSTTPRKSLRIVHESMQMATKTDIKALWGINLHNL